MNRNISIHEHFIRRARNHQPTCRFDGHDRPGWQQWREALAPRLAEVVGPMPAPCPPNAEVLLEWREEGLIKQRILIDVEADLAAPIYLYRPDTDQPCPLILCCHGHGPYGKEAVMGHRFDDAIAAHIEANNYDYGLQMARAGFATLAIDWRGFGERDDRGKPFYWSGGGQRDLCNLHYLRSSMFGQSVLAANISDGMRALDYACALPGIDGQRVGVMGLSFGGTMATWMALMDKRIAAADVICYSDRFADFGFRDLNFCGSQIAHGLYELCDVPDLQGMIAPRPLLVEIGIHDRCFLVDSAMSCYREVERIYKAAGVPQRLVLDLFEGPHAWGGNHSVSFFRQWLTGETKHDPT